MLKRNCPLHIVCVLLNFLVLTHCIHEPRPSTSIQPLQRLPLRRVGRADPPEHGRDGEVRVNRRVAHEEQRALPILLNQRVHPCKPVLRVFPRLLHALGIAPNLLELLPEDFLSRRAEVHRRRLVEDREVALEHRGQERKGDLLPHSIDEGMLQARGAVGEEGWLIGVRLVEVARDLVGVRDVLLGEGVVDRRDGALGAAVLPFPGGWGARGDQLALDIAELEPGYRAWDTLVLQRISCTSKLGILATAEKRRGHRGCFSLCRSRDL